MVRFLDFLFPPRKDESALRSVSKDAFFSLLSPRLVETTRPQTVALMHFSDPNVKAALHEAKYHGTGTAIDLLSATLAEYIREVEIIGTLVVVPIPLGPSRQRERGFNQVDEVVKRVAKELGLTMDTELLARARETESQVSLPRAKRIENMRGAFSAAHPADPAYTYIVIDDVTTTGATLQAAIDALVKAGARSIIPLALAH